MDEDQHSSLYEVTGETHEPDNGWDSRSSNHLTQGYSREECLLNKSTSVLSLVVCPFLHN